jgi:Fe-S cluster assembly ATP-binding protein
MGPNGSGKSTLAATIIGHPSYEVTQGSITFMGIEINQLAVDKRAQIGIFLACQQPPEIPGVNIFTFLKEAYCALGGRGIGVKEFQAILHQALDFLGIEHSFVQRNLNEGFSGGEKKRLELLQLLLFKPQMAILDEIDSGLDVDALNLISKVIAKLRTENPAMIVLLITHYQRIIDQVMPDAVHVMRNGALICSGDYRLAHNIEKHGYENIG